VGQIDCVFCRKARALCVRSREVPNHLCRLHFVFFLTPLTHLHLMATIVVFGTLDTKGAVHRFLAEFIRRHGHAVLLVDVSLVEAAAGPVDVARGEVLQCAGLTDSDLAADASAAMGKALGVLLAGLFAQKRLAGVISVGGRLGMRLAGEALKALPFGVPSAVVTHVPQVLEELVESGKDVTLFPCSIKPADLNRIVRPVLKRAARALCAMLDFGSVAQWMSDRPLIVASRFGHAQFGFERAERILHRAGYDVVWFTRRGAGEKVMGSVIAGGVVSGVLDLTIGEFAQEVVNGFSGTPSGRLGAAAQRGIAAVVAPGGMDAVDLGKQMPLSETEGVAILEEGASYWRRTSASEGREIGVRLAECLNGFLGPLTVCLPTRGFSKWSGAGQPFHDPGADRALIEAFERHSRKGVRVLRIQANGEDTPFVERCVLALLENIRRRELDSKMLRGLSILRNASEVVVRELGRHLEALSFAAGESVQGPRGEHEGLYCISQGVVEVVLENAPALRLEAGDTFGEQEIVFGKTRSFQMRALEDSEVLFLGGREFEDFCEKHSELEETVAALVRKGPKDTVLR